MGEDAGPKVLVTATSGEPYGIATIELPVVAPIPGPPPPPLDVRSNDGRVLFPIANDVRVRVPRPSERPVPRPGNGRLLGRLGKLIREIAGDESQLEKTVSRRVTFLVKGSAPLKIQLRESGLDIGTYEIRPVADAQARADLIQQWWVAFTGAAKRQIDSSDYPAVGGKLLGGECCHRNSERRSPSGMHLRMTMMTS